MWRLVQLVDFASSDGVLTLVRRSGPFTPGYAVFLDREFTVILTGTQTVAGAIAESSFSISHLVSGSTRKNGNLVNIFATRYSKLCAKGSCSLYSWGVGCSFIHNRDLCHW